MAKKRPTRRRPVKPSRSYWQLYLLLVPLVLGIVVFGNLAYGWMLALGSVIFVGFFGWLAWTRRSSPPRGTASPSRTVRKRKTQ